MIFLPLILAVAASAGFDQYGLPRPKPGDWIVTVSSPHAMHAKSKHCVHKSDDLTNLIKQALQDQAAESEPYTCVVTRTGARKGTAYCNKIAGDPTGMTVHMHLKWRAAIANGGSSLRADVDGYGSYGSADPHQPRGFVGLPTAPFSETVTGVYQGPCA